MNRRYLGHQKNLVRRPAINSVAASGSDRPPASGSDRPSLDQLPASVGHGNLMISTWVVGRKCDPKDIEEKLKLAPFDCAVVVLSTEVRHADPVFQYLLELSIENPDIKDDESIAGVLTEKAMYCLYEFVHSASVIIDTVSCEYKARCRLITSGGMWCVRREINEKVGRNGGVH